MAITKNLGGDRIGSGNKMNVSMNGYERSTHNLSKVVRTTQSIGTLVPVYCELGLPGDTWEIDLDMLLRTRPTVGPLFGSMKVEMHVYKWDIRLGIAKLHMNLLDAGLDVSTIKFPQIRMTADKIDYSRPIDNQQINPSCIFSYLGIRGLGDTTDEEETPWREFNALPWLAYWNIYKNYYANKQETDGVVIHGEDVTRTIVNIGTFGGGTYKAIEKAPTIGENPVSRSSEIRIEWETYANDVKLDEVVLSTSEGNIIASQIGSATRADGGGYKKWVITSLPNMVIFNWNYVEATGARPPVLKKFPLTQIDEMNLEILTKARQSSAFIIDENSFNPYGLALKVYTGLYSKKTNQEGLGIITYLSDKFNNWLKTSMIDSINNRSKVSTTGNEFTVQALIMKRKVYDYLNRIAVAGGSIDDWQEVTYDHKRWSKPEIPTYEGGVTNELIFEEVVSNSASAEQPLGTLGGRGKLGNNKKGGKVNIKCDETCYIMVVASIRPRIDYSQGNKWDLNLKSLEDLHKPEFDKIGFQDRITDEMAWWDTKIDASENVVYSSAGKQPAWLDYMTNYDVNLGNFADEEQEMFMVLNRRYEINRETKKIKDLTTYIDPSKYNHIWAYTAIDAQNVWAQWGVRAIVRRKMSAALMPTL